MPVGGDRAGEGVEAGRRDKLPAVTGGAIPASPPALPPTLVVGYCLSEKKFERLMRDPFAALLAAHRIEAQLLHPGAPIEEQGGPFSAILHKMPRGSPFERRLQEFATAYPEVPIIDPLEKIAQIQHRDRMLSAIGQLREWAAGPGLPSAPLRAPPQVFLEDPASSSEGLRRNLAENGVRPPLLVKPADPSRHEIYAVPDLARLEALLGGQELRRYAGGVVLQNFVDHGGIVHKIYVIGQHVVEDLRQSLPDAADWGQLETGWDEPLGRVSRYRLPSQEASTTVLLGPPLGDDVCIPMARALQERLELSLFNFDLIKDAKGHMYVIDINYFPGLSKVPGYEKIFLNFLVETCADVEIRGRRRKWGEGRRPALE